MPEQFKTGVDAFCSREKVVDYHARNLFRKFAKSIGLSANDIDKIERDEEDLELLSQGCD